MELVPLTLDYANPAGGQPLGSLFTVDRAAGGLTLTKPLPPEWSAAIAAGLVGVGSAILPVLSVAMLLFGHDRRRPWEEWVLIVGIDGLLLLIGAGCLIHARQVGRSRTLTVILRDRHLTVVNGKWTAGGGPWACGGVSRFTMTTAHPDLIRRRMVAGIVVHRQWWPSHQVLYDLPRDECIWVATLLNDALTPARQFEAPADG